MRYISEQFKEKQDELVRPALKMYFEVDTNIEFASDMNIYNEEYPLTCFDDNVAPLTHPQSCTNEHFYAVLGDTIGVDDPNRICSPDNSQGELPEPTISVPLGITYASTANTEYLIGEDTIYHNFLPFDAPVTLSFKGGVIPEQIRVERYDDENDGWVTETTITNPDLNEEILFTPSSYEYAGNFRRFYVLNSEKGGRYQLNWLMRNHTARYTPPRYPIVFENDYIVSVTIDEETDLTSQTLPSYEMTVECLDPDGIYSPDSAYWEKQFTDGTSCYLKAGYEINGEIEYIPFLFARLKERPTYGQDKLTFKLAVDMKRTWDMDLASLPNSSLNTGDIVDSHKFVDIVSDDMFDSYDVFHGEVDENGSEVNHYGNLDTSEARQLVANAMGCFIMAGFNTINLYNTNDIQYKMFDDYLTRYEQIQNTLESKPKVGKISVTRYENTLSEEYVDIQADEAVELEQYEGEDNYEGSIDFTLPFFPFGKIELIDAHSTNPSATVTIRDEDIGYNVEWTKSNGQVGFSTTCYSDLATTVQPTVRFYKVVESKYEETQELDSSAGEVYTNDNKLVTNGYNADKVKRVAKFMSDVSNQYEVDVVQDYRYELGDVVRLETEKNVFKTCVITGLQFKFPGSAGHLTCKKIFSMSDTEYSLDDVIGVRIINFTGGGGIKVLKADNNTIVVCRLRHLPIDNTYYLIFGATKVEVQNGSDTPEILTANGTVTDLNKHVWHFFAIKNNNATYDIPMIAGVFRNTILTAEQVVGTYGRDVIRQLYVMQNMTAPIDSTCEYTVDL